VEKNMGGLCITRRIGEAITILTSDGPIEICYFEQHGQQARLRIKAPKRIKIHRNETMQKHTRGIDEDT
jgi:carbon storage regulator CsrA